MGDNARCLSRCGKHRWSASQALKTAEPFAWVRSYWTAPALRHMTWTVRQLECDIPAPTEAMLLLDSLTAQCNLHTHCLSNTGGHGPCHRVPFVMWSELRSEACSWCVDVGLHCGLRLDPSLTDDLAGLDALFGRCATHDCVTVWRDVDESVTSVDYIYFSCTLCCIIGPIGSSMNKHT